MTPASSRWRRLAQRVEAALDVSAATVMFAMMALTFVDVVCRYLFNRSIPGSFEITEIMMAVLIFAGLPLVSRREEHVSVDLIDHFTTPGLRRVQRRVIELVSSVLLLSLAYLLWRKAGQVAQYGDTTTVLLIRLAPYVYLMAAFLGVAGIVHLFKTLAPDRR